MNDLSGFCPYCATPFDAPRGANVAERRVGYCPADKTPHHVECWRENGGCTLLGCKYNSNTPGYPPVPLENIVTPDDTKTRAEDARRELIKAIASNIDANVLLTWTRHRSLLDNSSLTVEHRHRIELAQQRQPALDELQAALNSKPGPNSDERILRTWRKYENLFKDYPPAQTLYTSQIQGAERRVAVLAEFVAVLEQSADEYVKDVAIKSLWEKHEQLLESYTSATRVARAKLAVQRLDGLEHIRLALKSGVDANIAAAWQADGKLLAGYPGLTVDERARIKLSEERQRALDQLEEALGTDRDTAITLSWEKVLKQFGSYTLTPDRAQRVVLAGQRVTALAALRDTFERGDQRIVETYLAHRALLETSLDYTLGDREVVSGALDRTAQVVVSRLEEAFWLEDDERIANLFNTNAELLQLKGGLSGSQKARTELAYRRLVALQALRKALESGSSQQILQTYQANSGLLVPCRCYTLDERRKVLEVQGASLLLSFQNALNNNDGPNIIVLGRQLMASGYTLTTDQLNTIVRVEQETQSELQIGAACASENDADIVAAVTRNGANSIDRLSASLRDRVGLAHKRLKAWYPLQRALMRNDDFEIARLYDEGTFRGSKVLSLAVVDRCKLAQQRVAAYIDLQRGLQKHAGSPIPKAVTDQLDGTPMLTERSKQELEKRQKVAAHLDELQSAYTTGDIVAIANAYRACLASGVVPPDTLPLGRILQACRGADDLVRFRSALQDSESLPGPIALLGTRLINLHPGLLTPQEQGRVEEAVRRAGALERVRDALARGNPLRVAITYPAQLLDSDPSLTANERRLIEAALTRA